jgi:uncharacterized protein YbjQ (UPF0145 family)
MRKIVIFGLVATALASGSALAGKKAKTFVIVNEAVGVPVFPHDISDRPYEVLGEVKAEVRKATIFSKEASQEKIYRELWERGEKLGADAVIKATYGDSRVTLMSWGSTGATGTAIRFVTAPAEAPVSAEASAAAHAPVEAAEATPETAPAEVAVAPSATAEATPQ